MKATEHGDAHLWSPDVPPRLMASRHKRSAVLRFPPFLGTSPLAAEHDLVTLEGPGTLYSCTTIHAGPRSSELPFHVGFVDMPGPVRVFGRIRGSSVAIGASCEPVFDAEYGYVFQVAKRAGST